MTSNLDHIFESLANPKRRGIVDTLAYRPATISQLAAEHQLSLPAIHKHLKMLERAQLIQRRKFGRTNFVALNAETLGQAQDWLNQYHTPWGTRYETLENYVTSLNQSGRD